MTEPATARLAMPLLAAGQAAKELTHNEALTRLDMLVQPAVMATGVNIPPAAPKAGECWIVGVVPTGAWMGHGGELAGWTDGGWRFATPRKGFAAWCISGGKPIAYRNGVWQEGDVLADRLVIAGKPVVGARAGRIADPADGTVVDGPARQAITAILGALRQHGLIES